MKPICHYTPDSPVSPLQSPGTKRFEDFICTIPQDKKGQHVIYAVWQRDDSPEVFYSRSDVIIDSETPEPDPQPQKKWTLIKGMDYQTILPSITLKNGDGVELSICQQTHVNDHQCDQTTFFLKPLMNIIIGK